MRRGFTLIELITVISVIAILAGVVAPVLGSLMDEAKVARMKADINALKTALVAYNYKNAAFPYGNGITTSSANYAYVTPSANTKDSNGNLTGPAGATGLNYGLRSYLSKQIMGDPWGMCYGYWYYIPAPYKVGIVCSYGPDKTNNGVWNTTVWVNNQTCPGDDYYDCFYKMQ